MGDQVAEGLLSPFLRRQRIRAALPHLAGRVLDFGCGSGALAACLPPERYCGVDIDPTSLRLARAAHPRHTFASAVPESRRGTFQTVVALAVIEHVADASGFLRELTGFLDDSPAARFVVTTPHPATERLHSLGSAWGIFSSEADQEHHSLLNRRTLSLAAAPAGLKLSSYRRFLGGLNQLAIFQRG
ncbi:MAG: class I SAM-dependent methyltransferase [Deltaproteobacteria bacterium]|nr:class I SAM-dependent methyltransferase [Deltaproteobacteria bacterium]